jgi:putative transposase
VELLKDALKEAQPEIFNTDQGSQFTSYAFTDVLRDHSIRISMDGKGRAIDNVFVERLWRSLKYECTHLRQFETVSELRQALSEYVAFYNTKRYHQSLNYQTPEEVYFGLQASYGKVENPSGFRTVPQLLLRS